MKMQFVCIALMLLAGCNQSTTPTVADNLGQFEGEVVAQWGIDGREMTLIQPISFIDSTSKRWDAPAGSVINGASIPSAFWSLIGGPFEGKYRNASVVHDVYCNEMTETWEDVHEMFYQACRSGGVEVAQAKIMYYAVYHFGPRWQMVSEEEAPAIANQEGVTVRRNRKGRAVARYRPTPPTAEEIEQVVDFVADENPTAGEMRQMVRDQLHRRPRGGDRSGPSQSFNTQYYDQAQQQQLVQQQQQQQQQQHSERDRMSARGQDQHPTSPYSRTNRR